MTGGYEDWDLWLRFIERGWRGVRTRDPLFIWRRHSPDTMVMASIRNHRALYRALMDRHPELYRRHKADLLARTSSMLCQFEMNWFDQDLRPINLAALKRHKQMYESMLAVRAQRALERRWRALKALLSLGRAPIDRASRPPEVAAAGQASRVPGRPEACPKKPEIPATVAP
jgi:hypothetical protein